MEQSFRLSMLKDKTDEASVAEIIEDRVFGRNLSSLHVKTVPCPDKIPNCEVLHIERVFPDGSTYTDRNYLGNASDDVLVIQHIRQSGNTKFWFAFVNALWTIQEPRTKDLHASTGACYEVGDYTRAALIAFGYPDPVRS